MGDEGTAWYSAIPEVYFDVIGKIPPGAFLNLVLLGFLISSPEHVPGALAKVEWGPALGLLMMLLFGSYATGLLIAPVGELANQCFWRSEWKKLGKQNFHLLKEVEKQLRLDFQLGKASDLEAEQWNIIYSTAHTPQENRR